MEINIQTLTTYVFFWNQPAWALLYAQNSWYARRMCVLITKSRASLSTFPGDCKLIIILIILPAPGKSRQILYSVVCVAYNL